MIYTFDFFVFFEICNYVNLCIFLFLLPLRFLCYHFYSYINAAFKHIDKNGPNKSLFHSQIEQKYFLSKGNTFF